MPHLVCGQAVVLARESERMVTVRLLDGRIVISDMAVHVVDGTWYLPSGELFHSLGLMVDVALDDGLMRGEFLSQERKFLLSSKDCKMTNVGGHSEDYRCHLALRHEDELFLASNLVEKLVPLRLRINSFRSEIIIDST